MKRWIAIILVLLLLIGITGCEYADSYGSDSSGSGSKPSSNSSSSGSGNKPSNNGSSSGSANKPSNNSGVSGSASTKKETTPYNLMNALKNDGYAVERDRSMTASEMNIDGTTDFAAFYYGKMSGDVEYNGFVCFFQLANEQKAVSAYSTILNMCRNEDFDFRSTNGANGKKAIYTEGDPFVGSKEADGTHYIISQVGNSVIFAWEEWDYDGTGTYTYYGVSNVLQVLGY